MDFIVRNLESFGLENPVITAVINDQRWPEKKEIGRTDLLLSEACSLRSRGLGEKLKVKGEVDFYIRILKGVEEIGWVDCDGRFSWAKAPDLRSALGWRIATDGGSVRSVEFFDIDRAAKKILGLLEKKGTAKKVFFGPYFDLLRKIFDHDQGSRFGDGYCGSAIILWQVATRQLGQEHEGYFFMH